MNRSDIIARLAKQKPQLLAKDVALAVAVILDTISATLSNGGRAEIRSFGSFGLNYRPPLLGRNPKTGDKVEIQARFVPHFKSGKELRWRINRSATKNV